MLNRTPTVVILVLMASGALVQAPARAEKADRSKPMTVEADKPGTVDLQRQVVQFNGNVVITQGTMQIRAESIEVRERSDGFRAATATGTADKLASFRQKRDGVDEVVEGLAERIEFDAKSDTLRLVGQAAVRRLRGGQLADEINGALITWDNTSELFSVQGGATSPGNPTGRVRAMFTPPQAKPASAPEATGAVPLKASRSLGMPR